MCWWLWLCTPSPPPPPPTSLPYPTQFERNPNIKTTQLPLTSIYIHPPNFPVTEKAVCSLSRGLSENMAPAICWAPPQSPNIGKAWRAFIKSVRTVSSIPPLRWVLTWYACSTAIYTGLKGKSFVCGSIPRKGHGASPQLCLLTCRAAVLPTWTLVPPWRSCPWVLC